MHRSRLRASAESLVAHLVAVAMGALQYVPAPSLPYPRHVGKVVAHSRTPPPEVEPWPAAVPRLVRPFHRRSTPRVDQLGQPDRLFVDNFAAGISFTRVAASSKLMDRMRYSAAA